MATTSNDRKDEGIRWAREWLMEVDEARKALDRAESIKELRRAKAFSISDPLGSGGPHGKGGVGDPMRKVDDMIDGEAEDATYGWARDALALFDLMAAANKPLFRGQLLSGLDIAEMKYRLGASDSQVMQSFAIGKSKLHEDLGVLVDYLDYIGPEQAFHVDAETDGEPEAPPHSEGANGPHCDAYGDIDEIIANCGSNRTVPD